jgi:hypothetical protein
MLLLRFEQTDQPVELQSALAREQSLLDIRLRPDLLVVQGQRLVPGLPLDVTHRVSRDLKQPAGEAPVAAKARKLRERGREHRARHVLACGSVANPQPRVAEDTGEVAVVQREERTGLLTGSRYQRRVRVDRAAAYCRCRKLRIQFHIRLILSPSSRVA